MLADEILPRERADALEEFLKAARLEPPDDQQDAVGTAGMQVGFERVLKRTEKARAAVFRFGVDTQPDKLTGDDALQTERGGRDPFISFHIFLRWQSGAGQGKTPGGRSR